MALSKEEFKKRWESDEDGGGITIQDIADCAVEWKIYPRPMARNMLTVIDAVCKAAGTSVPSVD